MSDQSDLSARTTPSQTIGPFFRFGFDWIDATHLVDPDHEGAIVLEGSVLDGAGDPVPDAVVEIWQADEAGTFPTTTSGGGAWEPGFGRCLTDEVGRFRFVTVTPGAVDAGSLPHIDVSVFARGLLQRVVTRIYLPGTDLDATVADWALGYRFDIVVAGHLATPTEA